MPLSQNTTALLRSFGIAEGADGHLSIADIERAAEGHVHHTLMPVALAAHTMVSLVYARGRFPDYPLAELVWKRPSMDEHEARVFAEILGAPIGGPFYTARTRFSEHLFDLLERRSVGRFFYRQPGTCNHYGVRPRGYRAVGALVPKELAAWRTAYRALPAPEQMMVASLVWLYRGGEDRIWLTRVPKSWHAADAIVALRRAGLLEDWARLVALYPGW